MDGPLTSPLQHTACPRGAATLDRSLPMHFARTLLFLTLAVLVFVSVGGAGCSGKGEEEPLYLGHVAPLSRADRIVGEHARRGMRLAVEEANEEDNRIAGPPV